MKLKKEKSKYYSLDSIKSKNAHYNMIIGERSNGKTYAVLEEGIKIFATTGKQIAIIRRWDTDFQGKRGQTMFQNHVNNGLVEKYTNGEWTGITFWGSQWWFTRTDPDDERVIRNEKPLGFAFALSAMEHDKSSSYPEVTTVLFDEFLSRSRYLVDEFVIFCNVLSTIIRLRNDVKIYMCGNTVNKYSPYFAEMGLTEIKKMKPGMIDVYTYGQSDLRVAVEFSDMPAKNKPSDVYFAFGNPKLSMITGNGSVWEMAIYPHCPVKFTQKDVQFIYYICFDRDVLQCEIVQIQDMCFTFVHRKTTPIRHPERDLIYSTEYNPRPNWRRKITKPTSRIEEKIVHFYKTDKIFYQDNEIGEIMMNYLMWCNNRG